MSCMEHAPQKQPRLWIRFARAKKGATAIEFAIAFPVFIFFFCALLEFCFIAWGNSLLDNILNQTAREGMVGCLRNEAQNGNCVNRFATDPAELRRDIVRRSAGFIRACDGNRLTFSAAPAPGYNTATLAPNVVNLGQSEEVVAYRITYDWPTLFPILNIPVIFRDFTQFQSVTIVRNEPFGANGGVRVGGGNGGC